MRASASASLSGFSGPVVSLVRYFAIPSGVAGMPALWRMVASSGIFVGIWPFVSPASRSVSVNALQRMDHLSPERPFSALSSTDVAGVGKVASARRGC
jgi:hypothetical protein